MKLKSNKLIKTYYLALLVLVVIQAFHSIFGLSQTIYYQKQLNQLQTRHDTLLTQKARLRKETQSRIIIS